MAQENYVALPDGRDKDTFISVHRPQLITSAVPEHLWESLYHKLKDAVFDAGEVFQIAPVESDDFQKNGISEKAGSSDTQDENGSSQWASWKVLVISDNGIDQCDPNGIYLIDHAWTFRPNSARLNLQRVPNLLHRMASLMNVEECVEGEDALVDKVLTKMWRYCQTYAIRAPNIDVEGTVPVWYIMDEFGSRIRHSDEPTFRTVPFFDSFSQMAYSLLFPVKNVEYGAEVTRDFVEGPEGCDPLVRKALKLPWFPYDMTDVDFRCNEPEAEFFMSSRQNETLPITFTEHRLATVNTENPLKLYSEYEPLVSTLMDLRFEIVENAAEADILWLTSHFKDFRLFSENQPEKFINQFPYESVLTTKDLLSAVCRRITTDETDPVEHLGPQYFPVTFNLKTELPQFLSYFQQREKRGLDNHWICKPWNLARGLDTHLTNNLDYILRLPASGPKIACKYIENPVLFYREDIKGCVKFDIRYIVLLQSVEPLSIYVYKRFWIRFANRPYSLDHLDDYEKHFTVMNYRDTELQQMYCDDFIKALEEQYPEISFKHVEADIFSMVREVFMAATRVPPPCGIAPSVQSRAMYGLDIMLKWDTRDDGTRQVQPMLLEVNWAPDCIRACQYYPEFFDDVLTVLFLGEGSTNRNVQQI